MPALLLLARVAAADGTLDLSSPDLLVSTELHGMGGAGIAFATSAGGLGLHPGAAAHRRAEQRRFSGGGATLRAGTIRRDGSPDVGSGWPGTWSALNVSAGFSLLQGPLGALVELRRAGPEREAGLLPAWESALDTLDLRVGVGLSSMDGTALIAAAPRLLVVSSASPDFELEAQALGIEIGAILHPVGSGLGLGVVARSPLRDERPETSLPVQAVERPAQIAVGLGWSSAGAKLHGPPVRLAADLVIESDVPQGLSPDPWLLTGLDGQPEVAWQVEKGRTPTLSPRGGAELALFASRLRLRAGTWWEPARTELVRARLHGTAGVELGLFRLKLLGGRIDTPLVWRAAVDFTEGMDRLRLFGIGAGNSGVVGGADWDGRD